MTQRLIPEERNPYDVMIVITYATETFPNSAAENFDCDRRGVRKSTAGTRKFKSETLLPITADKHLLP
jgi:hypothetical protein